MADLSPIFRMILWKQSEQSQRNQCPISTVMRHALAEVTSPNHLALHFAHAVNNWYAFGCLAKSRRTSHAPFLLVPMTEMPSMWTTHPDFIPQRDCSTSPLVVDMFYNAPPFICLNHCNDTGTIPVATGHPPTVSAQNSPQQVHHQNEQGGSIPGRPIHASVMANERWGLYQQPDVPNNVPMHLLHQPSVCSIPRA